MMLNLKYTFLLSLIAVSAANPTFHLQARARIPDPLLCDGETWTRQHIYDSIQQARNLETAGQAYPKPFGNKNAAGDPIFGAQGQLWEFPLVTPPWNG